MTSAKSKGISPAKRPSLTEATIRRYIKAGRAEDPRAIIEIETAAGILRYLPEASAAPATPYDEWRAKRDARQAQGYQ